MLKFMALKPLVVIPDRPGRSTWDPFDPVAGPVMVRQKTRMSKNSVDP